jgi:release factor glutamine methyltransferase
MNFGGVSATDCKLSDPECQSAEVISAIERRADREPLQYILGFADFYRERYRVSPDCLIPRSDTENLVDFAVKNIPAGENFLDLCTGSGCIGISTVKNTVDTSATLVDISPEALLLAEENAVVNGVCDRVTLLRADVMTYKPEGKYFAILSNPPYVRPDEYDSLEREIYFEPKIAFLGGDDGMDFYKRIIELGKGALKPCGFIALEIGYTQGELIRALGASEGFTVEIFKDLCGNDRVAVLKELKEPMQ